MASDNSKSDIEKRSSDNRRAARDRRSGVDIRSEEEKRTIGERRANADRRSGKRPARSAGEPGLILGIQIYSIYVATITILG